MRLKDIGMSVSEGQKAVAKLMGINITNSSERTQESKNAV